MGRISDATCDGTSIKPNQDMARSKFLRRVVYAIFITSFLYLVSDRLAWLLPSHGSPNGSSASSSWNILYHLGGNGPWIPKYSSHGMADDPLPDGCVVDQVHLMSRHGERYPTKNVGNRHLTLLKRLTAPEVKLQGSLQFLRNWSYFTDPAEPAFENLTSTGPYAGTDQARNTGQILRRRYDHLVNSSQKLNFWSCSSPRDIETARYFADGFFKDGWDADGSAQLHVIPEEADREANTLTPGDTCLQYIDDPSEGHDKGYGKLADWQDQFTRPISDRLSGHAPGVSLSALDIYSMMEMCGFEVLVRGHSPWCNVFSHDEWRDFEYARDLLHFYRAGPGNKFSKVMGWLYLNATSELLMNTDSKDVYISFVHDGDIVPLISALQVLDEDSIQELPTKRVKDDRKWKTSDVVPMGGRVIFERIACASGDDAQRRYVRLLINDGVVPIPGVTSSKDVPHAVVAESFWRLISSKLQEYGEFVEVCGLPAGAARRITFLHQ